MQIQACFNVPPCASRRLASLLRQDYCMPYAGGWPEPKRSLWQACLPCPVQEIDQLCKEWKPEPLTPAMGPGDEMPTPLITQ